MAGRVFNMSNNFGNQSSIDYAKRRAIINKYLREFNDVVNMYGQTAESVKVFKSAYEDLTYKSMGKSIGSLSDEERELYWVYDFLGMFNTNFVKWDITSARVSQFLRYCEMIQRDGYRVLYQIINTPSVGQKIIESLKYCWGDLIEQNKNRYDTDQNNANISNASGDSGNTQELKQYQFLEQVRSFGPKGAETADKVYRFILDCKQSKAYLVYTYETFGSNPIISDIGSLFDTEQLSSNMKTFISLCNTKNKDINNPRIVKGTAADKQVDSELTSRFKEIIEYFQFNSSTDIFQNWFYQFVVECATGRKTTYTGILLNILSELVYGNKDAVRAFSNIYYGWSRFYSLPVKGSEYNKELSDEQKAKALCPSEEAMLLLTVYDCIKNTRFLVIRKETERHAGLFFGKKEKKLTIEAAISMPKVFITRDQSQKQVDVRTASEMTWLGTKLTDTNRKDLKLFVLDEAQAKHSLQNPGMLDRIEAKYNDEDSDFLKEFRQLPRNGFLYNYIVHNINSLSK